MTDPELVERARERLRDLHDLQAAGLVHLRGDFFPSVHYPPITMYGAMDEAGLLDDFTPTHGDVFSLYVHIPFCEQRCVFCHYPVLTGTTEIQHGEYLDVLAREMDLWRNRLGIGRFRARSVLVAGGTPTALSPALFRRFHEDFTKRVDLGPCRQLAYDVHPADLLGPAGAERLRIMRDHGSARLTIGTQAYDDEVLRRMNRGHDAAQALASVEACRKAGYEDICTEFIFGYPDQTVASWIRTIRQAIASGVEEIQLYRLKVVPYGDEAGPILRQFQRDSSRFPTADEALLMKQVAILLLEEAGFRETLTRVFARDPHHFSHYASDQCCKLHDQIGFGLSAFSSLHDRFSITPDTLEAYCGLIRAHRVPIDRGLVRSPGEQARWCMVLPLKNREVFKKYFRMRAGRDVEVFRPELDLLVAHGLLEETPTLLRLTPRGRFFADEVCHRFHTARYRPFPREDYADGPLNPWRART